ncbi:hypothetical protein R3P38DRAFT_2394612, partial [Favolaschia claudopus]
DSSLLADNELTELLELVALDWMEIAAYLGDTSRGPYNNIPKSTDFFSVLLQSPDRYFRNMFRMGRSMFDALVAMLYSHEVFQS